MGRPLASLEQRMVNTYLDTFPPFVPAEDGPGPEAQQQFHGFMERLYRLLYDRPELLIAGRHEDDAHSNRFNAGQDHKPKLKEFMRKALKEVDGLLAALFQLGQSGRLEDDALAVDDPVKLRNKHRLILTTLGIRFSAQSGRTLLACQQSPRLFHAWSWMATRPGASLLAFSRCFFHRTYPYPSDIYARLLGETPFRRLEAFLLGQGYTRFDNLDHRVSLDYANTHGDPSPIKGGFQYGIHHTGIAARYDLHVKEPPVLGLCIPRMKDVLAHFADMSPALQDFVLARTKHCDGCRYCVQTDKTRTRPLAFVTVTHAGREVRLCPYFPGYRYCWSRLDEAVVDQVIAMLAFMDEMSADPGQSTRAKN